MLPKARQEMLTIRNLPEETLVYDLERHKAHCLNPTAALVWQHCDGQTTMAELARVLHDELSIPNAAAVVRLALEQLDRRHLLEQPLNALSEVARRSRRDVLKKLGAAAAALPVIMTIGAPRAKASISVAEQCNFVGQACSTANPCPRPCLCSASNVCV